MTPRALLISAGFDEVFFFRRLLFLAERFERLFLDLVTLVWSMYGCSGMLSAVATRVVLKELRDGIAAPDSGCNLFGKLLTIRSILSIPSFGRVSEKTALDEHGRYVCPSQDEVATATHAAVR